MGRENQPKHRQARQLQRKQNERPSYDRLLIVSEGSKTEPLYFKDIRATYRLHSANVTVYPSDWGTSPLQVVNYARALFEQGDPAKNILPRAFEYVFAIFDRDDHHSYFQALDRAAALDRKLRNDARQAVRFEAIASVPSFELWLLLHYEQVLAPIHRDEVFDRLKCVIPGYAKGMKGVFAITRPRLEDAHTRAHDLSHRHEPKGSEPYTDVFRLVNQLKTLVG